jgi:predicted metal-dependent phosphoesterase TrpH
VRADLHLHTTASDGLLSPAELVQLAASKNLDVIAITDHDTIDGIEPALQAGTNYPSLVIIPGVELSTDVPHGEVHMLGYFIDYTDYQFTQELQKMRDSRKNRAMKMIEKLGDMGMKESWQHVQELALGGTVGRPHVAQAMLDAGHISSFREAFDKYIGREGPAYVEREKMEPAEAVELIVKAQGIPVLAHPADIEGLDELLKKLKIAGLMGIETYYNNYPPDVVVRIEKTAKRFGLLVTGGSDYHAFGDEMETMIGAISPPSRAIQQLFDLAGKRGRGPAVRIERSEKAE